MFEVRTLTLQQDGLDAGHIHLRFRGQMSGDVVVAVRFVAVEKFPHRAFSGIVSGQREPPILETVVEIFQILGGCGRARFRLITLVARPQGETEPPGRVRHQLKKPRRSGRAHGTPVKSRFHLRHPDKFRRNLLRGENRLQLRHIFVCQCRPGETETFFTQSSRSFCGGGLGTGLVGWLV